MNWTLPKQGLVLVLLLVWSGAAPPAFGAAPPRLDGQIARWISDLESNQFTVRQAAHDNLLWAGQSAVSALASATRSTSLEVSTRAFRILQGHLSSDRATADAARDVLAKLAASGHARAEKAQLILLGHLWANITRLEQAGGKVTLRDDKIVAVDLDAVADLLPLLPLVRQMLDLESLSASNRQMDDAAISTLKGLPKLQELNLYRSGIGDEGLKHLKSFPQLRSVQMGETKVTDAGLKHLAGLTHLDYVGVRGNRVTDAGLAHLRKLTNLTGLYLGQTKVTDAGLVHLKDMKKLGYLRLHNVEVTDAGLKHLIGLTKLRRLDLWGTKVTQAGVDRLRKALPDLEVILKR